MTLNPDFEAKVRRGQPENAGSFAEKNHSNPDPAVTLGNPAGECAPSTHAWLADGDRQQHCGICGVPRGTEQPTVFTRDGRALTISATNPTNGVYHVGRHENEPDPLGAEFFVPGTPTNLKVNVAATKVYDALVWETLRARREAGESSEDLDWETKVVGDRLEGRTAWDDLPKGEEMYFYQGDYQDDTMDSIDVTHEMSELLGTGVINVDLMQGELFDDDGFNRSDYLDDHQEDIEEYLRDTYSAELDHTGAWNTARVTFTVTEDHAADGKFPGDIDNLADLIRDKTEATRFYNDVNNPDGKFFRELSTHLQAIDREAAQHRAFEQQILDEGR